jgi:hypothetical protein
LRKICPAIDLLQRPCCINRRTSLICSPCSKRDAPEALQKTILQQHNSEDTRIKRSHLWTALYSTMSSPVLSAGLCKCGCTSLKLEPPPPSKFYDGHWQFKFGTLCSMENEMGGACSSDGGGQRSLHFCLINRLITMFSNFVFRIYASSNYYSNKPYIFTYSRYNYNGKSNCTLKVGHLEVFLYRSEVWLDRNLKKVYSDRNML